jgi:small subunit ribosomal protein S9
MGDLQQIVEPLEVAGLSGSFFVSVLVKGGGITGQASAVRHGLARALLKSDPELRPVLRQGGFLTRDARVKERKKPGLKRARKAPQYTKR